MPKGGARVRSAPAPDPNALSRERDGASWAILPAEGRNEPPPQWPLTAQTDRECHWWATLWSTPQAVQWERLGQVVEVALYVRRLSEAEERGASVALATLVRQLADALGLTIPGMRSHRWRIAGSADDLAIRRAGRAQEQATDSPPTTRRRFKVVRSDDAEAALGA